MGFSIQHRFSKGPAWSHRPLPEKFEWMEDFIVSGVRTERMNVHFSFEVYELMKARKSFHESWVRLFRMTMAFRDAFGARAYVRASKDFGGLRGMIWFDLLVLDYVGYELWQRPHWLRECWHDHAFVRCVPQGLFDSARKFARREYPYWFDESMAQVDLRKMLLLKDLFKEEDEWNGKVL